MKGSTQAGAAAASGLGPAGPTQPQVADLMLEVGSKVSATVLELLGEGRVLVGLRGLRVEARAEVPLEPGSRHLFTVLETGATVRLALREGPEPQADPLDALLARLLARAGALHLPGRLAALRRALLAAGEGEAGLGRLLGALLKRPEAAADLRGLARGLGLGLERELARAGRTGAAPDPGALASLKALLLVEAGRPGPFSAEVEGALAALEGLQGENLHLGRHGGGLLLPLPLFPGLVGGEVRFLPAPREEGQAGGGAERSPRPFRVLLALDLERLGPLRVGVECRGRDLGICFECGRPETLRLVARSLPELGAALEAAGLRPLALEAVASRPPERAACAPARSAPLEPGTLVDIEG